MNAMAKPEVSRSKATKVAWADNKNFVGSLFMLPAAAFLILFLVYPLGLGIWL